MKKFSLIAILAAFLIGLAGCNTVKGVGKSKQIKELYALDYWDKTLEQYFGSNIRIINKAYFPTGDSFKKALCSAVLLTATDTASIWVLIRQRLLTQGYSVM